jgi:hypothetical protein
MRLPSLMSGRERKIRKRLRDDFGPYAKKCLQIRTKAGKIEPLILNYAQKYLHGRLEAQRERTGKVRALVLQGRQQGISTYIGGRYYWRATHSKGVRVFIQTHEQDATNNLFGMVDRYHSHCPTLVCLRLRGRDRCADCAPGRVCRGPRRGCCAASTVIADSYCGR